MEHPANTRPTVAVVVDSTSSLTPEHTRGLPVEVAPLQITVGGRTYQDGVDLSPEDFYQQITDDSVPAQTAAPSPASFQAAFQRAFTAGMDVLCITTTSKLSVTHAAAQGAMDMALGLAQDRRGIVLDSGTAGGAEALVALAAARLASAGGTLDEVAELAASVAGRVYFIGVLESLRRLQRGGRVPLAVLWAASLLQIKPILGIWPGEGEVRMVERPRTRAKALERVLDIMGTETAGKPIHVVVMHTAAPAEAAAMQRKITERFQCVETMTTPFTPVIGAHTGPGLLGVAFYAEP